MKTEEELHQYLSEYFSAVDEDSGPPSNLDPEGKFAFVVVAFSKPAPENIEADHPAMSAADKAVTVGMGMAQACPAVKTGDDGDVDPASVMREGIHALCAASLARFLTEAALPQVVGNAQMIMRKRRGLQ